MEYAVHNQDLGKLVADDPTNDATTYYTDDPLEAIDHAAQAQCNDPGTWRILQRREIGDSWNYTQRLNTLAADAAADLWREITADAC